MDAERESRYFHFYRRGLCYSEALRIMAVIALDRDRHCSESRSWPQSVQRSSVGLNLMVSSVNCNDVDSYQRLSQEIPG